MTIRDEYVKLFSPAPLDGSRLAKDIADSVPWVNQEVRMNEWRAALKERVRQRLQGQEQRDENV